MTDNREFKPGQRVYSNTLMEKAVVMYPDKNNWIDVVNNLEGYEGWVANSCVKLDDRTNTITLDDLMARDWGKVGI